MHFGIHHYHKHKKHRQHKRPEPSFARLVDMIVYAIGVFGVLANIPQLTRIWLENNTSGVSLVSWSCFLLISIFWFIYGIVHREKPIILANLLLIIVQSAIVAGIIITI